MKTLGVFWIPVTSKAYLPFVPTLLLFDLVLSTAADITGRAHRAHQTTQVQTQQLSTECRADTHQRLIHNHHNFSLKECLTNPILSAFLLIIITNNSRAQFCESASHKTTTMTTTISLNSPFNVSEIDSFAEVSNRDIFPFVATYMLEILTSIIYVKR